MKKIIGLFILLTLICGFSGNAILPPPAAIKCKPDSLPKNILIINAFDAMSLRTRKNKKELFGELADSLKQYLYNEIRYRQEGKPVILPESLKGTSASDSCILILMQQKAASISIVIRNLNVYFNQTGVEVTGIKGNKHRTASYDICSDVDYETYNDSGKINSYKTDFCDFFTERNVISGFFSGGPDVVGKSKYTFEIVNKNAGRFLLLHFP